MSINNEQLSNNVDYIFLKENNISSKNIIFSEISSDEYLDKCLFQKEDKKTWGVYAKIKNLNSNNDYRFEDIAPKSAIEIGLKFEF